MKKDELLALAVRCEQGSGPDRELDALIWWAVYGPADSWVEQSRFNGEWLVMRRSGRHGGADVVVNPAKDQPPQLTRFSASLDAAMTLVPESYCLELTKYADSPLASAALTRYVDHVPEMHLSWSERFKAMPPARAISAVALRARAVLSASADETKQKEGI